MRSKEMNDYRLAFALFGTLNGFANLTRDFTDLIYSCDSNYIVEIYKEFHGQLFGNSHIIDKSDDYVAKSEDNNSVSTPLKKNEQQESMLPTTSYKGLLEYELFEFEEFTSRDAKTKKEIIDKLIEAGVSSLLNWDNKKIDSIKLSTSKGQKKLMTTIAKSKQNEKTKRLSNSQQDKVKNLFEVEQLGNNEGNSKSFNYHNIDLISQIIKSNLPNVGDKAIECIVKD
jgi:hypothetical protein